MAQWEDDLREVVDENGAALLRFATEVCGSAHDARGLVVDALTEAFRRGSPLPESSGARGAVVVTTHDAHAEVVADVRRRVVRAVTLSEAGASAGEAPASRAVDALLDGTDVQEAARGLAESVAERVRTARARSRRRMLAGVAAAVGIVLVATGGVALAQRGATAGPGAPTATSATSPVGCGQVVPEQPAHAATIDVTTKQPEITGNVGWIGSYTASLTGTDADSVLSDEQLVVVLAQDGKIVADGVPFTPADVTAPTSTWLVPPEDLTTDRMSGAVRSDPAELVETFMDCSGALPDAGDYVLYVFGVTEDNRTWTHSAGTPLTMLPGDPTGQQPDWLQGSAFACGERVDETMTRIREQDPGALVTGPARLSDHGVSLGLTNVAAQSRKVQADPGTSVAWVRDGKIVSVGGEPETGAGMVTVGAGKTLQPPATPWDTTDYCRPSGARYPHRIPAGRYDVLLYTLADTARGKGTAQSWFARTSDRTVTVAQDGSVRVG